MPQSKVLVVYKESAYTQYLSSRQLMRKLRNDAYWHVVLGSHRRHHLSLQGVLAVLKKEGLETALVLRNRIHHLQDVDRKYRMVVSVGGDGTLLYASHFVRQIPVLGVNSDPERSVARFSSCDGKDFPRVLRAYLSGRLQPTPVPRMEFRINGRKNHWLVLNDLLITTASPAGTSRYILKVGARVEEQMSSGIWISTAAGSTAATLSAGGRRLPAAIRKFQYVVREAYQKKFGRRKLLKGVLGPETPFKVVSYMKEGKIFIDGANLSIPFPMGDLLEIRMSSQPLSIIGLRK